MEIPIAAKFRGGGEDLIVFLHGLGCAKESFDDAFSRLVLEKYSLLALDLPAHGDSAPIESGDLPGVADAVTAFLREVPRRRMHLVCHSMGGAIGLIVAQTISDLAAFISVEGNLVAEDCGLVSRKMAEQPPDEFVESGFCAFAAALEASAECSDRRWAQWFQRCDPRGLHRLARSLLEWCDNDKLVGLLPSLRRAAYVHGARSEVGHLTGLLRGAVPMRSVAESGHFPMLDNPGEFYALIGALVDRAGEGSAPAPAIARHVERLPMSSG